MAEWHDRKVLPDQDDGISLTREMSRVFQEGRGRPVNDSWKLSKIGRKVVFTICFESLFVQVGKILEITIYLFEEMKYNHCAK